METILADLINNAKVPKIIRYIIVSLVCLFIVFIGIMLAFKSPMVIGKVFGGALSILFLIVWIYLLRKIYKS